MFVHSRCGHVELTDATARTLAGLCSIEDGNVSDTVPPQWIPQTCVCLSLAPTCYIPIMLSDKCDKGGVAYWHFYVCLVKTSMPMAPAKWF